MNRLNTKQFFIILKQLIITQQNKNISDLCASCISAFEKMKTRPIKRKELFKELMKLFESLRILHTFDLISGDLLTSCSVLDFFDQFNVYRTLNNMDPLSSTEIDQFIKNFKKNYA